MPDNIPPWVRRGCCVECNACYGILVVRELHRASRTYLFQNVLSCGIPSARVQILARFGNFYRGLRKSPSNEVAVLANIVGRDLRSTTVEDWVSWETAGTQAEVPLLGGRRQGEAYVWIDWQPLHQLNVLLCPCHFGAHTIPTHPLQHSKDLDHSV